MPLRVLSLPEWSGVEQNMAWAAHWFEQAVVMFVNGWGPMGLSENSVPPNIAIENGHL